MFDRHRVRALASHLRSADQLLQTFSRVRSGSPFSRALGAAAAAGQVLDLAFPERSLHDELVGRGYQPLGSAIDAFLCDRLRVSDLPRTESRISETMRLYAWDGGRVVAVWDKTGEFEVGPYLRGADLPALLQRTIWAAGEDLALTLERVDDKRVKLALQPMKPPGDYLGDPAPDALADRLAKRRAGSMLLYGPSGSGKSTLARLVGRRLRPGGRTLKLSAGVLLRQASSSALLTLVRMLRPTVLLLDDVQEILESHEGRRHGEGGEAGADFGDLLALMESFHGEEAFVVATYMTSPGSRMDGALRAGDLYFPGLRPGRIDLIQDVPVPDAIWRTRILQHYLDEAPSPELVKATAGLTGAYLRELAVRVRAWGMEEWQAEVKNLRRAAPRVREMRRTGEYSYFYGELRSIRRELRNLEERLSPPVTTEGEGEDGASERVLPKRLVKGRKSRRTS